MATTKQKPSKLTKPLPPCKVVYFTHKGSGTFTGGKMDAFRRTIKGPWGDYVLEIPHGAPALLIGEAEIAAFEKDLQAGSAKELELLPPQREVLIRELCDKAIASEFEAIQTAADELLAVSDELAQVKAQLASAQQQLASLKNPHADAPLADAS